MKKEFKSALEKILFAKELLFDSSPAFGCYKCFLEHSIAHPAKMNTLLLEFLIDNFTNEGETVLDPMAGSGSTGVVASLHGRNAVCVELEKKFFRWMEKAKEKVERQQTLVAKGRIQNICGDSRKLSELLKEADVVLTSPPYGETVKAGNPPLKKEFNNAVEEGFSCSDRQAGWMRNLRKALKDPDKSAWKGFAEGYSESKENIGNLPYGVDAVITSPPYSESHVGDNQRYLSGQLSEEENKQIARSLESPNRYGYSKNTYNIGNLAHGNVDAVITSPPYSEGIGHDSGDKASEEHKERLEMQRRYTRQMTSKENISNLKKETYLEAMLQVYAEMFKVLKPNGKAIIVIKPFIRNKQVVDLPYHTWLLLKEAGFKLTKLFKLKLKNVSFWRILYHKRYPSVPTIKHEWILICEKV